MPIVHQSGKNTKHRVMLYALSTCGWCRRTKELLDSNSVAYDYIYVDQCTGDERQQMADRVRELNPRGSYPTIQIDDQVVAGFDEDRIRELLEL
ncbi:MAG: glutaredoxin family protein [candidate division WOR-3 bacterium]